MLTAQFSPPTVPIICPNRTPHCNEMPHECKRHKQQPARQQPLVAQTCLYYDVATRRFDGKKNCQRNDVLSMYVHTISSVLPLPRQPEVCPLNSESLTRPVRTMLSSLVQCFIRNATIIAGPRIPSRSSGRCRERILGRAYSRITCETRY